MAPGTPGTPGTPGVLPTLRVNPQVQPVATLGRPHCQNVSDSERGLLDFNPDMVEECQFDNSLSARLTYDNAALERQAREMQGRTTVVDLD